MSGVDLHWFLPINGDSRQLVGGGHGVGTGSAGLLRQASLDYLASVAQAAEQVGFTAALTPTGLWCEDAWLTTAMLVGRTERLKFLVAFRPGFVSPTLAAQQAATFQRHSQGRLLLNVVTGGEAREQRAYGDFLDKDARYRRTGEFLHVVRALWRGETVDHDGGSTAQLEIAPNCGRVSGSCAAARARRWSAATRRWPTGSPSTTPSASTSSSCPATRTSRRRGGWARASCRSCGAAACGSRPTRRTGGGSPAPPPSRPSTVRPDPSFDVLEAR